MLTESHLSYLSARGISADAAERLYTDSNGALQIGYKDPSGKPYLDSNGNPYVVNRSFPTNEPKFKVCPKSGNRPYFSPLMPDGYLQNIDIPLVLIEGPIKVDACYLAIPTGFCFVGLTGTWNIKDRRDEHGIWNADNDTRTLPELKAIPITARQVIVLFDSDLIYNHGVSDAANSIDQWVRTRGGLPYRCLLPMEDGGRKNGADDYLVRYGAESLVNLLRVYSEPSGWPLPASLLTKEGDLKRRYTPREAKLVVQFTADQANQDTRQRMIQAIAAPTKQSVEQIVQQVMNIRLGIKDLGPILPGERIAEEEGEWLWDGIIREGTSNLIIAEPKVGKSALMVQLIADIAKGKGECLGFACPSESRPVVLVGTDQPFSDWRHYFDICGLSSGDSSTLPAPIVAAWTKNRPQYLNQKGVEEIATLCKEHPGAIVIVDSYFKCTSIMGIEEISSLQSLPFVELETALSALETPPTLVVIHHSSKAQGTSISSAARGHSSLASLPSQLVKLEWKSPNHSGDSGDRRILLQCEGRRSPVSTLIEMTDNGMVRVEADPGEQLEEQQEQAESKLTSPQRSVLEYVRKRWYESSAKVSTTEVVGRNGVDYVQKALKVFKRLQSLGLVKQAGSCTTVSGKGSESLWVPAEFFAEPIEKRGFTGFNGFSDPGKNHVNPGETTSDSPKPLGITINKQVNLQKHSLIPCEERNVPVELFANGAWSNGWIALSLANPDSIEVTRLGNSSLRRSNLRWGIDVRACTAASPFAPIPDPEPEYDF